MCCVIFLHFREVRTHLEMTKAPFKNMGDFFRRTGRALFFFDDSVGERPWLADDDALVVAML